MEPKGYGSSGEPLLDGFRAVLGSDTSAAVLGLFALTGLIASFHTIIYAYGRNIYSLSRAGYFPHWMSVTHGTARHLLALVLAVWSASGLPCFSTASTSPEARPERRYSEHGGVRAAVISYFMQMLSFIRLRSQAARHRAPRTGARLASSEPGLAALIALAVAGRVVPQ